MLTRVGVLVDPLAGVNPGEARCRGYSYKALLTGHGVGQVRDACDETLAQLVAVIVLSDLRIGDCARDATKPWIVVGRSMWGRKREYCRGCGL